MTYMVLCSRVPGKVPGYFLFCLEKIKKKLQKCCVYENHFVILRRDKGKDI